MIRGTVSVAQDRGVYLLQEDSYVCVRVSSNVSHVHGWLLAVMDGHASDGGGRYLPELCSTYIPQLYSLNYADQARRSLYELVQKLERITRYKYMGCTLSLALVLESHMTLTTATMGDSLVCAVQDTSVTMAPCHHVTANSKEREAAVKRGGSVEGKYIWIKQSDSNDRTPYGLQVTRCLGDVHMKDVILRAPEITTQDLHAVRAVLICSDGVCDVTDAAFEEDVAEAANHIRNGKDASHVLKMRTERASLKDNATIVLWNTY